MSATVSPLAPKHVPEMPEIAGVRLATGAAGIKYKGRTDVRRARRKGGRARALVVNSGNANAFTGKTGREAVAFTAKLASAAAGCKPAEIFLASTRVIG